MTSHPTMVRGFPTGQAGFSTLEMLVAMTVILLALSAVTMLLPGIQSGAVDTQMSAEALNVAQKTLEYEQGLARKDFKLVVATSSNETISGTVYHKDIAATSLDFFTKKVTVTVSWGEMYNRNQNIVLATLVSNFPNLIGGDTCDSILSGNWSLPQTTNRLIGTDLLGDSSGTYPVTGLEVFQKSMYVSVNAGAATVVGPNNPGTAALDTSIGTIDWASPANAKLSDNAYATANLNSNQGTRYLKLTNLGFAIPSGATVVGIQVEIERKNSSSVSTTRDSSVRIIRADGTLGATNKADFSTNWPTGDAYKTYGASGDLWGETGWNAAAINNANFGVVIAAVATSGGSSRTASIDHVRVTVYYTKQFYAFNLTTPTNPAFSGSLGSNTVSTGINAITVATSTPFGNYAYLVPNTATAHLQVLNIASVPTVMSTYQIPTATSVIGNTIFFKDGYVYIGTANNGSGPEFYIIDVHNPNSIPGTPLGSYEVGAGVNRIVVKDTYAYLATDKSNGEVVVVNLTDLAHPALYGTYDAPGTSGGQGKSLYTVGDTAYVGRYYSLDNKAEFAAVDTTTANPTQLGLSDVGVAANTSGVYGVVVRDYLAFLLLGNTTTGNGKLQIMNISNPANMSAVGIPVSLPNAGAPVALDCEGNYLYAASLPLSGGFANKGSVSIVTGL